MAQEAGFASADRRSRASSRPTGNTNLMHCRDRLGRPAAFAADDAGDAVGNHISPAVAVTRGNQLSARSGRTSS